MIVVHLVIIHYQMICIIYNYIRIESVNNFPKTVPHINHVYSRYLLLIIVAAYLHVYKYIYQDKTTETFKIWKKLRPEITKVYDDIINHVEYIIIILQRLYSRL